MPVTTGLNCSACGYALRGLEVHGNCPECGQSIRRSIAAHRLRRRPLLRKGDAIVVLFGASYAMLDYIVVHMMMDIDPFAIFHTWALFAIIAPTIMTLSTIFVWWTERNFHWITLMAFMVAMAVIGWLNFAFMAMCAASV